MSAGSIKPNVFDYDDFRSFMRDYISFLRSQGAFSNRKFAESAGFKSHSYVLMVLAGKRKLTKEASPKVAKGMGLTEIETEYFYHLCEFSQATDAISRRESFKRLIELKTNKPVKIEVIDQYEFYSNWYNAVIYESLTTEFQEVDFLELSQELDLDESEVVGSLELLQRLGLVAENANQYKKTTASIQTAQEAQHLLIRQFHRTMIEKATQSIDTLPPECRDLSSLTISMSPRLYSVVTEKIRSFRNELNELLSATPERGSVYQLNIQLFPILTPSREEDLA